jgi:hypothetical protein
MSWQLFARIMGLDSDARRQLPRRNYAPYANNRVFIVLDGNDLADAPVVD